MAAESGRWDEAKGQAEAGGSMKEFGFEPQRSRKPQRVKRDFSIDHVCVFFKRSLWLPVDEGKWEELLQQPERGVEVGSWQVRGVKEAELLRTLGQCP